MRRGREEMVGMKDRKKREGGASKQASERERERERELQSIFKKQKKYIV